MTPTPPNDRSGPREPTRAVPFDDLVAYLDGELDEPGAQTVEAQISLNPAVRREAESLRKTWDLLDYLPRPEPSKDFTNRTLERLNVAHGAAPRPTRRRTWRPVFAWLAGAAAVVLAAVAGYAGRAALTPAKPEPPPSAATVDADPQLLADLRIIDNLDRYQHVEDLDHLRELAKPDLFGDDALTR